MTDQQSEYEEQPRSYTSVWVLAAILGAGCVIDLALGGGIGHLIGWLIAFALLLGANFVIVYALRSSKSLRLTSEELRIGDEAIARADIVGVAQDVDDTELPVLG